jgi:predicted O-methyltransferase YrrM
MLFSEYKMRRLAALMAEPYGDLRIPDLMEVLKVARPKRVLEIGSYRGVSTEFWALHCEHVTSIDPSPNMAVRRDLIARVGHYPHVKLIEACSPFFASHEPGDFDLVYLDGDHSEQMVAAEIATYFPLLSPGAWIGGHDYTDTPAPGDGVKLAVDALLGIPPYRFSDGSWLVYKDH